MKNNNIEFQSITVPEEYTNGLHDFIKKSITDWFTEIENKLREIKEDNCPELSDEEFAKLMIVEFNTDKDNIPYANIRLKTAEEILQDIEVNRKCFMKL